MKLKFSALLVGLLMTASISAFAADPGVATVNGKKITTSALEAAVKTAVAQGNQDSPELRKYLINKLVEQEVLVQESEKRGLTKRADVVEAIEQDRRNLPIQAMFSDVVRASGLTEADVKARYEQYKAENGNTEYFISHIAFKTEDEAKAVIAKLKAGAKFDDFTKDSIDLNTATNGGKIDWFTPRSSPFGKVIATMQKGQYTDTPIQTRMGFHIVRVDDTRPFTPQTYDQLKERILDALQKEKVAEFVQGLMKKSIIKQ